MKSNLDTWIKDAKEAVPDSGEYRRLNRALLKERIQKANPDRRKNHRLLVMAASLIILVGFSGQISQLGSDSFETATSTAILPGSGDTVTVHSNVFRGGAVNLPEHFSEADVDEYTRSVAAGEGEIIKVNGISYGGRTSWVKIVRRTINGQINEGGDETRDPPSQEPANFFAFLKDHSRDLTARIKSEPPHGSMQMTVDGVLMDLDYWTFEYPGFGSVTRYEGIPAARK